MIDFLMKIFKVYGPWVGLIIFFVWTGHKREERMATRLDALEDYQKNRLEVMAIESVTALKENSLVMREVLTILRKKNGA